MDITEDDQITFKSKLLDTFNKYDELHVPYKHRKTIKALKGDTSIVVVKQDKGRGVIIIDRHEYTSKCLAILNDEKTFGKYERDLTKAIEEMVQRAGREIKDCLSNSEYIRSLPYSISPWKVLCNSQGT